MLRQEAAWLLAIEGTEKGRRNVPRNDFRMRGISWNCYLRLGSDCACDRALSFHVTAGKASFVARKVPDPQRACRIIGRALVCHLRAGPLGADPSRDPYRRGNDRELSVRAEGVIKGKSRDARSGHIARSVSGVAIASSSDKEGD